MKRTRQNYWTCSKFADRLRGTKKIHAGTSKEWSEWNTSAKASHVFRFWVAEEGLGILQDVVSWPKDVIYTAKCYIRNRFDSKTHALTSNLKRGEWHEFETRLLHCMFDAFVDFVEIEEAWYCIAWDKEARKRYEPPFYAWGYWKWRWRCPEAGLEALRWAAELNEEDSAKPTQQAITAREAIELYDWWKNVRPNRPDPFEASGWSAVWKKRESAGIFCCDEEPDDIKKETKKALELCNKIEAQYEKEDEKMMIRLIKIRNGLWT